MGFINPRVAVGSHSASSTSGGGPPIVNRPARAQFRSQNRSGATFQATGQAALAPTTSDARGFKSNERDTAELPRLSRTPDQRRGQSNGQSDATTGLPPALLALADPSSPVMLPPPGEIPASRLNNWKLDVLVSDLGKNRATWRRAMMLFEWLKASCHELDDRLCTTLIRICSDHGDAIGALSVFDWMVAPASVGGGELAATTYTYTAAMRAALSGGMLDRAMQVWNAAWADSQQGRLALDARLCVTYIELCARLQLTEEALTMYQRMRAAPRGGRMAATVHAYTAAMRAASEGGCWIKALDIWDDMVAASCEPTGHSYAAAISACAVGQDWRRAVAFFDEMSARGIRPDVVSCTALITALATAGEADKAQAVVTWMLANNVRPNARTYTALLTALGNAKQWTRAVETLRTMQQPSAGGVQPNAYTYSALLKSLGEHGQWQLAEAVFSDLERQVLAGGNRVPSGLAASAAALAAASGSASAVRMGQAPTASIAEAVAAARAHVGAAAVAAAAAAAAQAQAIMATAPPSLPSQAAPSQLPFSADASAADATASSSSSSSSPSSGSSSVEASGETSPEGSGRSWTRPSQLNGLDLGLWSSPAPTSSSSAVPLPTASSAPSSSPTPSTTAASSSPAPPSTSASLASSPASPSTSLNPPPAQQQQQQQQQTHAASPAGGSDAQQAAAAGFSLFSTSPADAAAAAAADAAQSSALSNWWQVTLGQIDALVGPGMPALAYNSGLFDVPRPEIAGPHRPNGAPVNGGGGSSRPGAGAGGSRSAAAGVGAAGTTEGQLVNEVVCGALMLSYERAGKWQEAVSVLLRALNLGITPNTVMYNTAISAAGKAGQLGVAEKLYAKVCVPDAITHETLIAAYGMAGLPEKAEGVLQRMRADGFRPRDYAYCGLIAAHSLSGDWEAALRVRTRMRAEGAPLTVHVYNALLAACERAQQADRALDLYRAMQRDGAEPNAVTQQMMAAIGRIGVQSVETQQVAAAAVSAAVAAYGTLLVSIGQF